MGIFDFLSFRRKANIEEIPLQQDIDHQRIPLHVVSEDALLRMRDGALGSRHIEFHNQNKTVAASMIAEKKVSGQRS